MAMGLLVSNEAGRRAVATGERKELQRGQLVGTIPREFCRNFSGRKQFDASALEDDHLQFTHSVVCVCQTANLVGVGIASASRRGHVIARNHLVHGRPYTEHFGRLGNG